MLKDPAIVVMMNATPSRFSATSGRDFLVDLVTGDSTTELLARQDFQVDPYLTKLGAGSCEAMAFSRWPGRFHGLARWKQLVARWLVFGTYWSLLLLAGRRFVHGC